MSNTGTDRGRIGGAQGRSRSPSRYFREFTMMNQAMALRTLSPARHRPAPAAGHFGFTKLDIERLAREEIAERAPSRTLKHLTS